MASANRSAYNEASRIKPDVRLRLRKRRCALVETMIEGKVLGSREK